MNCAQCGEDQNKRIKFGTLVITDISRGLKGHLNELQYVTVLFTKQHAYILKEFLQFLPRFSTRNAASPPLWKCYFSLTNACILRILSYKLVTLRSKRRVSSDHASMKNISGEVSIFCLWTNWIHLVSCSKIQFRVLHYCSRCALDTIYEIYTFDRCPHEWSGQKLFLEKRENWRTTFVDHFWNMCPKPFS